MSRNINISRKHKRYTRARGEGRGLSVRVQTGNLEKTRGVAVAASDILTRRKAWQHREYLVANWEVDRRRCVGRKSWVPRTPTNGGG